MIEEPRTDSRNSEGVPDYDARELMCGGTIAIIHLDGQSYTLRITRTGKLILTK